MTRSATANSLLDVVQAVPAIVQGKKLLRDLPRLPDASGPHAGHVAASAHTAASEQLPLELALLGESTASGVGAPTQSAALVGRLASELASHSSRAVNWSVVGQNGATIRRIRHKLAPQLAHLNPDIAVLAAGANDVIDGRSTSEWEEHLRSVIATLERPRSTRCNLVVVTGVPPFAHFPALRSPLRSVLARRADRLDARSAAVCAELGVLFLPFDNSIDLGPDFFAADDFHPSEHGYALWAAYLAPHIERARTRPVS